MPIIVDNNFQRDTYGIRAERLNAIQGNFATVQPDLEAPAHIALWAASCYDDYMDIWTTSGVESDQGESATLDTFEKGELMELEYQNARTLAISLYRNDLVHYRLFEFDSRFPDNRNDKIQRARKVIETNQNNIDSGFTPLLPASIITRLNNAIENYAEALRNQDKERGEADVAHNVLVKRFDADTAVLQELRAWWYAMMGKKDPRITWIGMVNPNTGGNTGQVPAVPTNLVFNYGSRVLWWDSVPTATSYQLQWWDGTDFVEIYSGSDDHFAYTPADGLNKFKIRARNGNGFSEFSPVLEQYYFEVLPKAANLQVVQSGTIPTEGELTWDAVPTAFNYKIYQSVDNLGEYAAHWLVIGTVTEPLKSVTLTLGKRNSFKVETNNTYQTSMSDVVYVEV